MQPTPSHGVSNRGAHYREHACTNHLFGFGRVHNGSTKVPVLVNSSVPIKAFLNNSYYGACGARMKIWQAQVSQGVGTVSNWFNFKDLLFQSMGHTLGIVNSYF